MKAPPPKDKVFKYWPGTSEEANYFLERYPAMPDKSALLVNRDSVYFLSDDAFVYFLPFFVECLRETPYPYDTLCDGIGLASSG